MKKIKITFDKSINMNFKDAYFKILPCGYNVEELWQKVNHHISNKDIISDELANALSIVAIAAAKPAVRSIN